MIEAKKQALAKCLKIPVCLGVPIKGRLSSNQGICILGTILKHAHGT